MAVSMTKKDEEALSAAGKAYNEAKARGDTAGMEAAHQQAEAIRSNYGYSGGTDGSQYIKKSSGTTSGGSGSSSAGSGGNTGFDPSKYTPIDTSGNDYASMAGMSAADQAALKAAGDSWNYYTQLGDSAKAEAAHKQAEAIRQKYNYSGGVDGSQYIPLEILEQVAPEYNPRYQDTLDKILNQYLNRDPFSYDPNNDPLYLAMQNMYTREGNRAMLDTLGTAAGRTGGMASSYAVGAANQANNYMLTQLGDKIPDLQQLAYEMYLGDEDAQLTQLKLLQSLENDNYDRYLTDLDQWNTDRNFEYGVSRDEKEDQYYEDELAYDRLADQAELLASAGDFSGYKALGYTDAQISLLENAYKAQSAAKSSGGSSGRVSSGGSGGSGSETGIVDTMLAYGDDIKAYEYLVSLGKTNGVTEQLWSLYQSAKGNSGGGFEEEEETVDLSDINAGILTDIRSYMMSLGSSDDAVRARELLGRLESLTAAGRITPEQADRIAASFGY